MRLADTVFTTLSRCLRPQWAIRTAEVFGDPRFDSERFMRCRSVGITSRFFRVYSFVREYRNNTPCHFFFCIWDFFCLVSLFVLFFVGVTTYLRSLVGEFVWKRLE